MSPRKSSPHAILTASYLTTMQPTTFRTLIEEAVAREPLLNGSFIVGDDPALFRITGMDQRGDILLSHCDFSGVDLGTRLALRYRRGDQALLDRLIVALGMDLKPVPRAPQGCVLPHEGRTVGHVLLEIAAKLAPSGLRILPSAIESGLDCQWDDEAEIRTELALLAAIPTLLLQGGEEAPRKMQRVHQLLQGYPPLMAIRHHQQTLPLRHRMHLLAEDGQTTLRLHFARDPWSEGFMVGWVDEV